MNESNKIRILINVYIKIIYNKWIPNDIIDVIIMFCKENKIPVKIFDQHFKCITKKVSNIVDLYVNCETELCITLDSKLYIRDYMRDVFDGFNTIKKYKLLNKDMKISLISQGMANSHVFIYTMDGKLYGYGQNDYKQLGRTTPKQNENKDILIDTDIFKSNIVQIQCGSSHSVFLTEKGNVFGCGSNFFGELTNKHSLGVHELTQMSNVKDITQIGCCENSTFVLDINGIISSFGKNDSGVLGINIDYIEYGKIYAIYGKYTMFNAGSCHVGVINENNHVLFWGDNMYKQCGSNSDKYKLNTPTKICVNIGNVYDIKCGSFHNIIKTSNNEYYSFGNNENHQLLLSNNSDFVLKPTKINKTSIKKYTFFNGDIIDIIPGNDTSYILQKI